MSLREAASLAMLAGMAAVAACKGARSVVPASAGPAAATPDASGQTLPRYLFRGLPLRHIADRSGAELHGVSAIARDSHGTYWLLPERHPADAAESVREVVPVTLWLEPDGGVAVDAGSPLRFDLPDGDVLDTEALAWIADDRFALGTEGLVDDDDAGETIFVASRVTPSRAVVDAAWSLPADAGFAKRARHGIEAMCSAAGWLLAAPERNDGGPIPLAVLELATRKTVVRRLHLAPELGNEVLSAMTCRAAGDGLEALAVARGRGQGTCEGADRYVHHLVRFRLDPAADGDIASEFVDLDAPYAAFRTETGYDGSCVLANLEGIAWLPDGVSIAVVTDDTIGRGNPDLTGTLLFALHPAP